jgi:hypothetical protein
MEKRVAQTSKEAYEYIKANKILSDKKQKVYDIFYEANRPMTGSEVSGIYKRMYPTSQHSETIRNRITELNDEGFLEVIGTTICPNTKRNVSLFQLTKNIVAKKVEKETFKSKKEKILAKMKALGLSLPQGKERDDLRVIYHLIERL